MNALKRFLAKYKTPPIYWVVQVPGIAVVGLALGFFLHFELMSHMTAGLLMFAWLLKDLLTFPLVSKAYEKPDGPTHGVGQLIGRDGEIVQELNPEGYIRVGIERWRARSGTGETLARGERVTVVQVEERTLVVETPAKI